MITNQDMRYHPEAMAALTDASNRHSWAETFYMPFAVPDLGLFGSAYLLARPGLGVVTCDIKIYRGLGRARFDALYSDSQHQLPAPADFRKFSLPSGLSADLEEGPDRYRLSYVGVDDTRFELDARAIMPAYDIHDASMDPVTRKSQAASSAHSGFGAAYGGHYDQLVRIRGELVVRGERFAIDYVDCMDRSWGVRPERGLAPMAWQHAIFGEDYGMHAIWSMDYTAAADAQHTFAHGFVLQDGQVHGCTGGKVTVQRDGMWGTRYDVSLTDERGVTHQATGTPVASGLWEPYGCCGVPNVLNRYVSDSGRVGYGEVQEGWFWDTVLRLRAAGKL